jgi:unsaturated chondroitin disaccharide hydrolase
MEKNQITLSESDKKWVNEIWGKADKKMRQVAPRSKNKIPYTAVNGVHDDKMETDPCQWTNGFWPGLMWLLYVDTKAEIYKEAAEKGEEALDAALENFDGLHHDVGFMWNITSGVNYRLFGGKKSRLRTITAANVLASRYNLNGKFIRAWNGDCYGWAIIDCMMNIPILYWASKEIGDPRYAMIAESHADTTMENHIRPDGSANHILVYDHINGAGVLENKAGQGYEVGSSWSRGQSWALYGFILSYIHTGKQKYLDTAKRAAHYFISNVYNDWLPRCDFRAPAEPVIYDSTAGACAACGLIEIARAVPEFEKKIYLDAALNILKAMEEKFCDWNENTDCILGMGTEAYNFGQKHIPIIYGDYYFVEALYKLRGNELLFW